MARAAMANLITCLRRHIGDPSGASQTWSDNELQDTLDQHRTDHDGLTLERIASYPAGVLSYLEYAAPVGDWEEDAALADSGHTALTPAASDYLTGRWTFASEPSYPVSVTG